MTHQLLQTLSTDMFHVPVPIVEKILRPVIVYLCLIVFLRLFGKRELAQLNPFDLVVLLSLANTVQNAMIGDDNSVSGGIVGAFALLTVNWLLTWLLFRAPKVDQTLEGSPTTLIRAGAVDEAALKRESLTLEELISVLNKNGFNDPGEVEACVLQPNGSFFVKGMQPSGDQVERAQLMSALEGLRTEVIALREQIAGRG
ncbi:MAG TPA: YetF domain-containing protein [Acidobacteriaceae bacterium]|nr:YetF domain-containing protein [Acidobacteriaceae bacterium]